MTSKSLLKNDNDDESINKNDEIEEKRNFVDAIDFKSFFLLINVISKNIKFASQQTQLMRESLLNEQLQIAREKNTDELINENVKIVSNIASVNKNIVSLINLSRKCDKVFISIVEDDKNFIFIIVDRNTRFKINKLSLINYKKLHNSKKRSKETINYLNDLYNVKHIFNLHNHM